MGGVSPISQILGSVVIAGYAFVVGLAIYAVARRLVGIRLTDEQQRRGADLSIHSIGSMPEGSSKASVGCSWPSDPERARTSSPRYG